MKHKILVLIIFLFCGYRPFAQTVPFGYNFKTLWNPLQKGQNSSTRIAKTQRPVNQDAIEYLKMAAKLDSTADQLENNAVKIYTTSFDSLIKNSPTDQSGLTQMQDKKQALDDAKITAETNVSAFRKAAKEYRYLAKTAGGFNWFFVKNSVDAEMYYNGTLADSKTKFLNNTLISFGTDGGQASISNELYSDYYGPIRIGLSALISNKQTSTSTNPTDTTSTNKNNAIQQLLGGGGNGVLSASYPLVNIQSSNVFFVKLTAAPKLGIDVPKIGTNNSSFAVNYNIGAEGSIFYTGALNVFTFFSNFRFARIAGNGMFYDNLAKADHQSFGFDQLSFGLAITSSFRLSYNYYFGSSFVNKNFPATISFTVIPN